MLDWAEGEPDNDLTKSYPFPVPRIRMLPREFVVASCGGPDLSSSSASSADENTTTVQSHEPEIPVIITTDESVKSNTISMSHFSSDSQLFQFPTKPKRRYTTYSNRVVGNKPGHITRVPRPTRSNQRHFTFVKSVTAQPPDATQDDVSKARIKLQNRSQTIEV